MWIRSRPEMHTVQASDAVQGLNPAGALDIAPSSMWCMPSYIGCRPGFAYGPGIAPASGAVQSLGCGLRSTHSPGIHMVQTFIWFRHRMYSCMASRRGITHGAGVRYASCIKACPPNGGNGAILKDRPFGQHGRASGNGCRSRFSDEPLPWVLANVSDGPLAWDLSQSSDVTPASVYFTHWMWLRYRTGLRGSVGTDGPGIPTFQTFMCVRCRA